MFDLQQPRHIPTLPFTSFSTPSDHVGSYPNSDQTGDAVETAHQPTSLSLTVPNRPFLTGLSC
jgi:hypothetical protein